MRKVIDLLKSAKSWKQMRNKEHCGQNETSEEQHYVESRNHKFVNDQLDIAFKYENDNGHTHKEIKHFNAIIISLIIINIASYTIYLIV